MRNGKLTVIHTLRTAADVSPTPALRPVANPRRPGGGTDAPGQRFVVVIPVYNHGASVGPVVQEALERLPDTLVLVIDDGSTDQTADVLARLEQQEKSGAPDRADRLRVIRHRRNRGKGAALWTGFRGARAAGGTHALTIDADGQHLISDVLRILRIARLFPDDLIIGNRQMDHVPAPPASKRGCDLSRYWIWIETGQDVPDTQCGLRVYPLTHTLRLRHWFKRFDFETETLARHAWAGLQIRSAPIACIYFSPGERITHYRPFRDTMRGVRLNVLLVVLRLFFIPCRRCQPVYLPRPPRGARHFWRFAAWRWAIGRLVKENLSDSLLSTAVGVGILIAFLPVYGLQTLLAIYVARRLHLNVLIAVLASQVSIFPLTPLCLLASAEVGSLVLYGHFLNGGRWHELTWRLAFADLLAPIIVGGIICGLLAGTAGIFITRYILRRCHARGAAAAPGSPIFKP